MKTFTPTSVTEKLPYFDGHCDTLTAMDGRYGELCLDLTSEAYSKRGQVFAICGDISPRPFDRLLELCLERFEGISGTVLCRDRNEFESAENRGKCAAIFGIEGAEAIDCDPCRFSELYGAGVKVIGPTWNIYNGLCGTASELSHKGLTEKGREFCGEAVRLGMKLDVSHASEAAALEMVRLYGGNVFASHSNSFSVCSHRRNISDRLFLEIAESGGTVGINLYAPFVSEKEADIHELVRHIVHFAELSPDAVKHISLGFDLDGCDDLVKGFSRSADAYNLAFELEKIGFDKRGIIDIFHDNLFDFIWKRQDL